MRARCPRKLGRSGDLAPHRGVDVQVVGTPEGVARGWAGDPATLSGREDPVAVIGVHTGAVIMTEEGEPAAKVTVHLAVEGTADEVRHAGRVCAFRDY